MVSGLINKIIPFSSVDGPGNRTAIFLQGCNFDCIYCHNPETINVCNVCGQCVKQCPTQALVGMDDKSIEWNQVACQECDCCLKSCSQKSSPKVMRLTADELLDQIKPYKAFIQGITVSGGECTLQQEFLVDLFQKAHRMGLTCYLDTNGSSDFKGMTELLTLTDGVMLDVKVWDEKTHIKYIGMTNKMVLENLIYLSEQDKLYEVRTVVVPELFDNEETVKNTAKIIGEKSKPIRYKLIKFRQMGVGEKAKGIEEPSQQFMNMLEEVARANGNVEIWIV